MTRYGSGDSVSRRRDVGAASGWSAYQRPLGPGWQWTACGPGGTETGEAPSRADAQRAAQAACERLKGAPGAA